MKRVIKREWKLKSRILSLMLVISMVVSSLPMDLLPVQQATAAAPSGFQDVSLANGFQDVSLTNEFQDVSPTDWFYDAVIYIHKNGIFNGTGDDTFSPQGAMTRAMYVTALGRMAGMDVSEYSNSTFADVQTGTWYAPYVEWAVKKGITVGTSKQNFSPDATVSREQMVTMTLRYFESYQIPYQTSNPIATEPADLANISPWAVDSVVKLWQAGLFVGDKNGNFNPHAQATRAEAAVTFMRSSAVVKAWQNQNQEKLTPTPEPSSDNGDNSGGSSDSNSGGNSNSNSGGNSDSNSGSNSNTEYVLTFESNGGTVVTGQKVKYGSKAVAPVAPTKSGYVFSGWYIDSDLTNGYDFTAAVTGNITLYAKWTIKQTNSYTVSFISNGGTEVADQTVEEGAVASAPDAPTREGYTFDGWYMDSDLTNGYDFTTAVTGNITLYAKWTIKQTNSYTVSFDSNGGSTVADQTVEEGEVLSKLPAPAKEGQIFQGWFRDSELSYIFAEGTAVTADTKLYAKYIDNVSNALQRTPSYSVLNVEPDFTIAVIDATGTLTASEVQAGMTFKDTANPDSAGITVTGSDGLFTVASATGRFEEGNTYQLTLTDDKLSFQGQDATTNIYMFSVAKQEVMNVPLNPNLIYLPFSEVADMMLNGADAGSQAIPVITTTMGDSDTDLAAANASSGTFKYTGSAVIQVGDTVAIYEGVRPDLRTVDTTGVDDGDVAYIQITAINGNVYTYGHADAKQVLFKPDVLPVSVEADEDEDPDNHSITVAHAAMNYSDGHYAPLGLSELTTVDVGDFIAFYEGELAEDDAAPRVKGYGRIMSITPDAERDVITYEDATEEEIKHIFDVYKQQAIDGDTLLSEEDIARLEDQIEQQAVASGFVDQAANYLSTLAMQTDAFKKQMEVKALSFSSGVGEVSVENLTVVASLGTGVKNINGQTSGVSATLQVGADIVIRIHEESDLVIHMTGTFLQEISLNLSVNGATEWGEACAWFLCVPYPNDYRVTADLDAFTYTGINITAEIATVEHDKLQDALDDWLGAKNAGRLGKVLDIATEVQALINGVQDTEVDTAALKAQYKEMMENETDWVPLIKKKLFENSVRVVFGTIEVNFTAEFVVSANVNLTIGADFNYTTAKRYSATVYVLGLRGTSDTVPLPGDGNYQFTFYVMGTLGLRAGILLELKAGVGSVKLNSIGIAVEPGAYVNLWGYFYYQLKNVNDVRATKYLGALIVEMGIYLESEVGAQLGDGLLSASVPIYENTWPLYTIGEQKNVDDFAYPQDESLSLNLTGSVSSIAVPEKLLTMSRFDLKTGDTDTQAYDRSRFDIQVDNPNFRYNSNTGKIEVVDKSIQVSEGNLVITWKGAPLSFTSEPLKRTIPLTWLAREGDYTLQLDPQNGETTQIVAAPYNAAISVLTPAYAGYTFEGWYTAASGGTKMTIPSQMPAEDLQLYAHWIANTNTPYTVQHYLIDPNTRTSTSPVVTETLTGTTGTEIRISSDRFKDQGYTDGAVNGVFIKGDGSTVVKLYYYPTNRTMTFDFGYTGAPGSTVTEPFGKNIAARIPMPTRPGYTFAGWSPEIPDTMPASDTSYTAKWTAKEDTPYQVVYLLQNIGSDTYTVADTESYRGTTDIEASLTNPTRTYEGFTFNASVPGTVLAAPISGKGTTVLKLYYKRNSYAMTVNYNGSGDATKVVNVPFGATTGIYLGSPTWQGHAFTGWSPDPLATMPAHDVEYTAQWTLHSYTVSFNSNGGSTVADQPVGYGSLASEPDEPTKDGLVFGGWYTDSDFKTAYDFTTAVVTSDVTLYAKWLHSYTVTFDSNGGSAVTSQTVNEGVRAMAPVAPTLEGYVFSGWYKDNGFTIAYDFTTAVVTADLTLYAKWTIAQKNSYTVSFISNGGTAVADQPVEEGAVAIAPPAPTREGHTFGGWYSDSALTIPYGFTAAVTEDITLYANWTLNSYTVSFDSNGGSTVNSEPVNHGGTALIPDPPTREGFVFKGWYTVPDGTNAYDFTTAVTASLTLYAQWTAVYTVSFESNGGTSVASQPVEANGIVEEPAAPTKDGYTFVGWYSDSSFTNGYSFATPVTMNITLYAQWTSNSYTVNFDSNGGPAVESQAVIPGGRAAQPAAPAWAGYTFDGWYTDLSWKNAYDFTTPVTADITLYAKWTVSAWRQVGDAMDKDYWIRLVFDSQGTPYASAGGLYVKKYEQGAWRTIGDKNNLGYGSRLKLAIDRHDVPYIVYYRNRTDELAEGTVVYKYNSTTSAWEPVGDILPYDGNDNFIEFDSKNTPYVVLDSLLSDRVNVVKFNGTQWVDVSGGEELNEFGDNSSIAFDEYDTPYLFYSYRDDDGSKWTLKKYEGNAWQTIGSEIISDNASFAIAPDGVPYVVYKDRGESWDAVTNFTVKRYDINSSSWQTVGNSAFATGPFFGIGIDFDSKGTPYVAYQDATKGNKVSVVKYEVDWSYVSNGGFSAGEASLIKLAIDDNDNIYVIYVDNSNGEKVTVMKYDPDWQPVTP